MMEVDMVMLFRREQQKLIHHDKVWSFVSIHSHLVPAGSTLTRRKLNNGQTRFHYKIWFHCGELSNEVAKGAFRIYKVSGKSGAILEELHQKLDQNRFCL